MSSQATTDGLMTLTVTFRLGTDPDKAQQLVQNRVARRCRACPRRCAARRDHQKSSPDLTMVVHLLSPDDRYDMTYLRNYALLNVKDRLARIHGVGQVQSVRRRRLRDARLARSAEGRRAACPPATWCARSASRTCRSPPACRRAARPPASTFSCRSTRRAGCRRGGVRRHRRQDRRQRRGHAAARRRPHRARRRRLRAALAARQQAGRGDRHLPGAGLERARRSPTGARETWPS